MADGLRAFPLTAGHKISSSFIKNNKRYDQLDIAE